MLTSFLPLSFSRWEADDRLRKGQALTMLSKCVCFSGQIIPPPFFLECWSAIEKFFLSLEEKKRSNNWRWKYCILACRLKAVEVLIWLWMLGGNVKWNLREFMVVKRMHRERSQLCHLKEEKKKDFNKWLALSPVRYSSCVWLTGWCWSTGGEQRGERVMEHIPNTLPEKEYPS